MPRAAGPCETFFAQHPYFDVAVRHEGEVTLAEMLNEVARSGVGPSDLSRVDLSTVEGLTFRRNGELVRTPDRGRTPDLSIFPSPYTTGEFDHWIDDKSYLPIETNRGCPYGCTFCDWGAATLSKVLPPLPPLSACTVPPCNSTKWRTIASPKPKPPCALV